MSEGSIQITKTRIQNMTHKMEPPPPHWTLNEVKVGVAFSIIPRVTLARLLATFFCKVYLTLTHFQAKSIFLSVGHKSRKPDILV